MTIKAILERYNEQERTKQYEVMVEEYVKAKGEASKLQKRLDTVIKMLQTHIEYVQRLQVCQELPDAVHDSARTDEVLCKMILDFAKGESDAMPPIRQ